MAGEVPRGWARRQLRDLCTPVRDAVDVDVDAVYQEIGIRSHGKGVFIKPPTTGRKLGEKRVFRVVPDAFVANIVFAWEGALARTTTEHADMVASHRFPMWQVVPDRLDLGFLVHYFRTAAGVALAAQSSPGGAGRNRTLNQTAFLRSFLPLPPLPEQQKIAAILSSVDDAIRATEAVIEQTRRVKQALLQELLTRGIGHTRFKRTEIGEIPAGWGVSALRTLIADIVPGKSPPADDAPAAADAWGVLKVSAVSDGGFRPSQNKSLPSGYPVAEEHVVRGGDVLMTRANTADLVGASCRVPPGEFRLMLCDKTLRVVPDIARLRADFLALTLAQPRARAFFSAHATGSSASMKNIGQEHIRAFLVAVPSLSEQAEIAARVAAVEDSQRKHSAGPGACRVADHRAAPRGGTTG